MTGYRPHVKAWGRGRLDSTDPTLTLCEGDVYACMCDPTDHKHQSLAFGSI